MLRVAVFGSFYRGYHVLHELLHGDLAGRVCVVGVATDDPTQSFVSPTKRVWQYPHEPSERTMVARLAAEHGIECWSGRVKTPAFYARFEQHWRPDVAIMATFGQRIDARLYSFPRLGFFNLHPCKDDDWPSHYVGGNPFQRLIDDGSDYCVIAMHQVDDGFDTGALRAFSERIPIPAGAGVVEMHKCSSPIAARLAARELATMTGPA
ncbi:formyltransferase family protein [Pseudazoarcus pumilus]|uniref:formyltransferase family protein n=1 Tax=Pseudazoarcus pumilus TaxID=2067960 RepID=UPI000F50D9B7|nr:formyltransferase family protein [Pseudazoarcus pumilus]